MIFQDPSVLESAADCGRVGGRTDRGAPTGVVPRSATGSGRRSPRPGGPELLGHEPLSAPVFGGQRQRIGIARALALRPESWYATSRYPRSMCRCRLRSSICWSESSRTPASLLFIAHDLSVVRHMSHRIAVMYLGRLAETGPTPTVYGRPTHPYTQALLSAIPVVDPAARGRLAHRILLMGDPPSPIDPPPGCRFATRCRLATDICRVEQPPLQPAPDIADGTVVACHHADTARRKTQPGCTELRLVARAAVAINICAGTAIRSFRPNEDEPVDAVAVRRPVRGSACVSYQLPDLPERPQDVAAGHRGSRRRCSRA